MSRKAKTTKSAELGSSESSSTEVVLEGEVTIGGIDELRVRFLAALERSSSVRIVTQQVTYLDAAALQLIWSLRQEAALRSIQLEVETPRDSVLADAGRLGMRNVFDFGKAGGP